ncbi:MAG: hypothetical protein K2K87_05970, partial [Lachnospiraceae bacterium]|nr:hypothetical protein [Lachnospiraceae bacterium]
YEIVDNVYAEILKAEQTGDIVIHKYSEIDPMEQKQHANYIKEHIDDEGEEMKQFYLTHFSSLWD